jgi:hypothetical protein
MAVNIPPGAPPPPLDLMKTNFVEFCKRYPKGDTYGERSTQPYFDPRLDGVMSVMSRGAEEALIPDALPDGATTDALVMRVDAYKAPAFTSLDPRIKTTSAALPKEMKSFSLKCFDLKTPIGIGTATIESMALMNPGDIEDLPTFSGVIKPGAPTPKLGDIVEVKYALGSFRTGQYIKGLEMNILPLLQQSEAKDSLVGQFAEPGQEHYTGGAGAPPMSHAEVVEKSARYHSAGIPNKSQHSQIFSELHPDFLPYVKAFITKSWEKQIQIHLNSGYRSSEHQQQLRAEWVAGGSVGPAPTRGTSYHNFGMAIDFNPVLADGTTALSTRHSAKRWHSSGVVAIGESVGLYWGGHFGANYDPVHFDFRNTLKKSQMSAFATAAGASGTALNRQTLV